MKILIQSIVLFLFMLSSWLFVGNHAHLLTESQEESSIRASVPNSSNSTQLPTSLPEEKKENEEKIEENIEKENKKSLDQSFYFSNLSDDKCISKDIYQIPLNSFGFTPEHSAIILAWICCFLM